MYAIARGVAHDSAVVVGDDGRIPAVGREGEARNPPDFEVIGGMAAA